MNSRMIPRITLPQFYKYLGRYVRQNPASARVIPPANRFQAPTEPGVGIFFYPPDEWTKTKAFAVGPLGQSKDTIHPSKFQIYRPVAVPEEDAIPEIRYWGVGGAVRVTKNLASGVSEGFAVTLELHGVGYRAEADEKENKLTLRVGFSHVIELPLNDGEVFFNVVSPQVIQVGGLNRGKVHQAAAKVRAFRPPEPYKGKGIRYRSEPVRRKETRKD